MKRQKSKTPGYSRTLRNFGNVAISIVTKSMRIVNEQSSLLEQASHIQTEDIRRYKEIVRFRVFWYYLALLAPVIAFAVIVVVWRHF